MAGTIQSGDDDVISAINVTPLVDIVLVLLIIFIVTASFILRSSIPLELPKAQTAQESTAGLLTFAISEKGDVYINGRPAEVSDIPAAVADARAKLEASGQKRVNAFVSADVGADYGRFAEVVDRLRLEGVTDIAMDTRPGEIEEPEP